MSIEEMQSRAVEIADLYDKLNHAQGRESWSDSDYVAGLVGDVGDLSKATMGRDGLRPIEDADAKFEHEIHDIVWSALVLAARNGLNLPAGLCRRWTIWKQRSEPSYPTKLKFKVASVYTLALVAM